MKLTKNELAVLTAIDQSEYGEYLTDEVWGFTLKQNMPKGGPIGKAISGTVASLAKKKVVNVRKIDDRDVIGMTLAGADAYSTAMNGKTKKQKYVE